MKATIFVFDDYGVAVVWETGKNYSKAVEALSTLGYKTKIETEVPQIPPDQHIG